MTASHMRKGGSVVAFKMFWSLYAAPTWCRHMMLGFLMALVFLSWWNVCEKMFSQFYIVPLFFKNTYIPMFSRLNAIFWQIGVTFFKVLFCTHPVACFYILLYSKTIQRGIIFFGKVNSILFPCIFVEYTDYNAKWRLNATKLIYFKQTLASCRS